MRQNWHEFGEYCSFADEWGCSVGVNMVLKPPEFGVYTLPPEELRKILNGMEAQAEALDSRLKRNRAVWFAELDRVRRKLRQQEGKAGGGQTAVSANEASQGGLVRHIQSLSSAEKSL